MMREGYFEESGLYYRTTVEAFPKKTLVFIHGVSGSSVAWHAYENRFVPHYDVLSVDLRGHGKSRKYSSPSDYALGEFAQDVHKLITHLSITDYVLISHSFGALVAMEYLFRFGSEVPAAVLISPTIEAHTQLLLRLLRIPILGFSRLFSYFPSSQAPGDHIDYTTRPDRGDWDIGRRFVDIRNTSFRVYLHAMTHIYDIPYDANYSQLRMPILVLHGSRDSYFPIQKAKKLSEKLPNAKFVTIEKADHIVVLNRANDVIAQIDEFLDTLY